MPTEVVILALELGALYVLGSYAMSHLAGLANARGPAGKLVFYLLVMPGVVVHESAHYLACKLTLTPVGRFVPFAPSKDAAGRITLGYVEHGARNPITGAIIGLAPVLINPIALVVLTGLITPIELTASLPEASGTGSDGDPGRLLASIGSQLVDFASLQLPAFLVWAYLAVSLALGSCPSREDLVAVPPQASDLRAWAEQLAEFAPGVVRAVEYPLAGDDLLALTRAQVHSLSLLGADQEVAHA